MEEEMICPPLLPSSLSSPKSPPELLELDPFTLHFASIFPPLLSISSSSSSSADDPDDLLFQARLVLQHRDLRHRHDLCLRRLRQVADHADFLHRENAQLRLANAELVKAISSKTTAADDRSPIRSAGQSSGEEIGNSDHIISPTSVIGKYNSHDQFDHRRNNLRRISFPKSISVRAAATPLNIQSRRDGGSRKREEEEEAMEMELELEMYNIQGMTKTEICNKWQDTGNCPYGEHCRFAHGLEELRPIMRHPRYKTQLCRMVLSGRKCPYGHRCHFRHSLHG